MKKGNKAFLIFLAVMLFFTVVSRVTDSFRIPLVAATEASPKRIEHIVQANGTVQANREFPLLTESGLLVKTVYVQEGERVKAGQLLAELDIEQLAEQTEGLTDEIRILELQAEAAKSAQKVQMDTRQKNIERAQADYEAAIAQKAKEEETAEREEKSAGDALNQFLAMAENGQIPGSLEEIEAGKQRLFTELQEKQKRRETIVGESANRVELARRAVEDAAADSPKDYTAEISEIQIEEKEKRLENLKNLAAAEGKLTAEMDGTLMGVFLTTGQKTTDTAAFTLAVTEGGVKILAEIRGMDAEYVQTGDAVSVEKGGKIYEDFAVAGMRQSDGSLIITVKSEDYAENFSIGDSAEIKIKKQSDLYQTAIPLSALHTDTDGDYVYLLVAKETVLGRELFAERLNVTVLDKNSSYAALEEGILGMEQKIIADSTRYISEGSRVRLEGE